ncbi:MAG TPA: hypothetical protein VGV85_03240, partial [Longimicrobiaceae bacterium]|nr:hypothetical protein [Longimicrobiaceae bacterium]
MTSPPPNGARRAGLSLERKLPLLITALLVVSMAAGAASAYVEVKRSAVDTALERLQVVAQQLASAVASSTGQRLA